MLSHVERLSALRVHLKQDQLDGFVVPLRNEHLSVYVGGYASGSRG